MILVNISLNLSINKIKLPNILRELEIFNSSQCMYQNSSDIVDKRYNFNITISFIYCNSEVIFSTYKILS